MVETRFHHFAQQGFDPKNVLHSFTMKAPHDQQTFSAAVAWCEEHIPADTSRAGFPHRPWSIERRFRNIYIRGEAEALAFKLRWC